MSDFDVEIRVKRRAKGPGGTGGEIVFSSKDDFKNWFNSLENGKYVLITYDNGEIDVSEPCFPETLILVKDGKLALSVEYTGGKKVK
jgi:pyruvate kinase